MERSKKQYKKWGYRTPGEYSCEVADNLLRNYTLNHKQKLLGYTREDITLIKEQWAYLKEVKKENFNFEKLDEAVKHIDKLLNSKE